MTMKLCESWIYSTAVFGVAVAGLLAGTMFAVWNGFVETELLPKRYSLVVATALLAIVLACQRVVRFKMGLATGAVCCVMAYFVVRTFLSPLEQPVIVWVSVAALLLLYVCFNAMPQRWDVILEGLVILVCVAQGIYGYCSMPDWCHRAQHSLWWGVSIILRDSRRALRPDFRFA